MFINMESSMERDLQEAANWCKMCSDYCRDGDSKGENVYSRQTRVYLGLIKDNGINGDKKQSKESKIARMAEEICRNCLGDSARIKDYLEAFDIKS